MNITTSVIQQLLGIVQQLIIIFQQLLSLIQQQQKQQLLPNIKAVAPSSAFIFRIEESFFKIIRQISRNP